MRIECRINIRLIIVPNDKRIGTVMTLIASMLLSQIAVSMVKYLWVSKKLQETATAPAWNRMIEIPISFKVTQTKQLKKNSTRTRSIFITTHIHQKKKKWNIYIHSNRYKHSNSFQRSPSPKIKLVGIERNNQIQNAKHP